MLCSDADYRFGSLSLLARELGCCRPMHHESVKWSSEALCCPSSGHEHGACLMVMSQQPLQATKPECLIFSDLQEADLEVESVIVASHSCVAHAGSLRQDCSVEFSNR